MKQGIGGRRALANGKTFQQIEDEAKRAIESGVMYWPDIALKLLAALEKLYVETEGLRQQELFGAGAIQAKRDRGGPVT